MTYAVIDFETTGLNAQLHDRVIEIGLVLLDENGAIEDEWTTLINPKRDIGATHIHGITAGQLLDAPEFSDISGHILDLVKYRTVVAHNAVFDMRFLRAELNRSGYQIINIPPALCTMKWSGRLVGPAKLQHACEALGIELINAHSALDDARATSMLLQHFIHQTHNDDQWVQDHKMCRGFAWPQTKHQSSFTIVTRETCKQDPHSWLDNVLNATWLSGSPEDEASYLLALERAMLDRNISRTEANELVQIANDSNLSGSTIHRLHSDYLRSVIEEAFSDGRLSEEEQTDINLVAETLGISSATTEALLRTISEEISDRKKTAKFTLIPGDRIVFTGEMSRPREDWISEIIAAGLRTGGITKTTKLVVASDPDSLSGKAVKARDYGIPIVNEQTFQNLYKKYKDER
jgi:DNA polymerase-3 subunit epsilon